MVCVVEYGENIGTLKNFFKDVKKAYTFVEKIIGSSCSTYRQVGPNKWYCREKKEYLRIDCTSQILAESGGFNSANLSRDIDAFVDATDQPPFF